MFSRFILKEESLNNIWMKSKQILLVRSYKKTKQPLLVLAKIHCPFIISENENLFGMNFHAL